MPQRGITLIEILVYIGLFAILFTGAVTAAYNVMESSGRNQTKTMAQQEGFFLLAKIDWALSGDNAISLPTAGAPGSVLSVNKVTGLDINSNPIVLPIIISLTGTEMQINYPSNPTPNIFTLNNSNVEVSNLVFTHTAGSSNGINPESVQVAFTLTARIPTGAMITQDFALTSFIRK